MDASWPWPWRVRSCPQVRVGHLLPSDVLSRQKWTSKPHPGGTGCDWAWASAPGPRAPSSAPSPAPPPTVLALGLGLWLCPGAPSGWRPDRPTWVLALITEPGFTTGPLLVSELQATCEIVPGGRVARRWLLTERWYHGRLRLPCPGRSACSDACSHVSAHPLKLFLEGLELHEDCGRLTSPPPFRKVDWIVILEGKGQGLNV